MKGLSNEIIRNVVEKNCWPTPPLIFSEIEKNRDLEVLSE